MDKVKELKPLGQKAYGSIAHLPGSRMGPADHHCHEGQARICTEAVRDKHDVVVVQEKLDGSCVSVANINGEIVSLGRAGYLASTSPYEQHRMFSRWVEKNKSRFSEVLEDGQRIVGEWLAQAHSTRYRIAHEPFVVFDIMAGHERKTHEEVLYKLNAGFMMPAVLNIGPTSIKHALEKLGTHGHHDAIDPVEGVVWRVERKGKVDFLAKYVRPEKIDGNLLPERNGGTEVWNWTESPAPQKEIPGTKGVLKWRESQKGG